MLPKQGDKAEARAYVKRLLTMGISVGLLTATAIVMGRSLLPALFSQDAAVIATAATALPIVAASMVMLCFFPCSACPAKCQLLSQSFLSGFPERYSRTA
jgi:Na+-driven multidrug efflux pump